MKMRTFICLFVTGIIQIGLISGEKCVNWSEGGEKECERGCCGDYGEHYCCFHWKVYAIVGGVIGGLVILGGTTGIIIFLCYYVNTKNKRQTQPSGGQVLQTYPGPNTGIQATAPYPTAPPPYPAGSQPYPTGSQMAPPAPAKYDIAQKNTYGQQDPAYPPPVS